MSIFLLLLLVQSLNLLLQAFDILKALLFNEWEKKFRQGKKVLTPWKDVLVSFTNECRRQGVSQSEINSPSCSFAQQMS